MQIIVYIRTKQKVCFKQRSPTLGLWPIAGPWPELDQAAETDLPPHPPHTVTPCTARLHLHAHSAICAQTGAAPPFVHAYGCMCMLTCMHNQCRSTRMGACSCKRVLRLFTHVCKHRGCPAFPSQSVDQKTLGTAVLACASGGPQGVHFTSE